jgi:membrane-bound serine protease (ClpP class)
MKYAWPMILQLLAFGVAFAEVMIPSFGLLGLLSVGLGVYSWYFIVNELPRGAAFAFGLADLILVPLAIRFGFKDLGHSPVSHQIGLGTGSGLEEMNQELARHVGQTAVADVALRPSGKVRIGSDIFEAQTGGEFVDRGAPVRVTGTAGNRLLVEKL